MWRDDARDRRKNGGNMYFQIWSYDHPAVFKNIFCKNHKICSRQAKCAKKRVLKVKWANPDLDIFEK